MKKFCELDLQNLSPKKTNTLKFVKKKRKEKKES